MHPLISRFAPASSLPLHRHRAAYAALVVDGSYQEYGADGRWDCEAGDLVIHPQFDLHGDRFHERGARVLDVPLPGEMARRFCVLRLPDPDLAIRAAIGGDMIETLPELVASARVVPPMASPAPLVTAQRALTGAQQVDFAAIAMMAGRSREHLTRSFTSWFGMTPGAYRREHRLRRALADLASGSAAAQVAAGAGYADQAHMCRSFRLELGITPGSPDLRRITPVQ